MQELGGLGRNEEERGEVRRSVKERGSEGGKKERRRRETNSATTEGGQLACRETKHF